MKKKPLLFAFLATLTFTVTAQPALRFKDGTFKIVQFTDIHYTVDNDDAATSLKLINDVLDLEKPDMVLFSGDIVVSKNTTRGWQEVSEPVVKRNIPFALTFGNHDDEGDLSRAQIYDLISKIPGNVNPKNPKNIKGYSNGAIEIKGTTGKTAAVCWVFDSNSYSTLKEVGGYGWFEPEQIAWYAKKSKTLTTANGGTPHPSIAFFHIALPEHRMAYDCAEKRNIGLRAENECPPDVNSGMFLQMLKCGDIMGAFVGHDHDNDYVANYKNILLGFGKFSGSKTTYTSKGSGARVVVLTEGRRELKTWVVNSDTTTESPLSYPADYTKEAALYRDPMLDSVSNVMGQQVAMMLLSTKMDPTDFSITAFVQGMKNRLMQKEMLGESEMKRILSSYFDNTKTKNKEAERAFLEQVKSENKKALATPSGLVYEIIDPGEKQKPTTESEVQVNYTCSLSDGTIIDSSLDRNLPATITLRQTVLGFCEGVQLIGEKGKIKLWVPSELAYGESGAGGMIPPHATVCFEVELLKINGTK